jgi:transcriptional regulator with XRE-family HTH domain
MGGICRRNLMKKQQPRYRRLDLINTMPIGEQGRIARRLGVSRGYVSAILNGRSNQQSDKGINVIRLAEGAAEKARCRVVRRK